jgi:hypothetical protein
MRNMFRDCKNFNQDLNDWKVDDNTEMTLMFYGATMFSSDQKAEWYNQVNDIYDFSDY